MNSQCEPQSKNIGDEFQTQKMGIKYQGQSNDCETESQN